MMHSSVKEIIEKYIHVIEQNNIEMLLYLCYRDRYSNFVVQQLRAALNKAGICSLAESEEISWKLFKEALLEFMKLNNLRVIPSLKQLIYVDRKLHNTFGIEMINISSLLHRDAKDMHVRVETDPNTYDIKVTYLGK